jgi:hypothetical protein
MSFSSRSSPWRLRHPLRPGTLQRYHWCSSVFQGIGPSYFVDRGPRSSSCRGPLFGFHRRRRSSPPKWRTRGWQLHPWRFHRPGWQPRLTIVLQPLERKHLHVARSSPQCLMSSGAGSPDCAPLRRTFVVCLLHASLRRAPDDPGSAPAPTSGDPHHDFLVPARWRLGPSLSRGL